MSVYFVRYGHHFRCKNLRFVFQVVRFEFDFTVRYPAVVLVARLFNGRPLDFSCCCCFSCLIRLFIFINVKLLGRCKVPKILHYFLFSLNFINVFTTKAVIHCSWAQTYWPLLALKIHFSLYLLIHYNINSFFSFYGSGILHY